MSSLINESDLQKLIDGELHATAIRELLKSADANPKQWREIAISFVEDRLWQRSFQQLETDSNNLTRVPLKPETIAKVKSARSEANASLPSWLALAAGLLLAVGVGYFAGSMPEAVNESSSSSQIAAGNFKGNVLAQPNEISLVGLQPEYQLELTNAMGMDKGSVPLYSAQKLEQLPRDQRRSLVGAQFSDEQRKQLHQSGYQVQQNIDFLSGRLKDGRTFVVPVRTVNLSSGQ